jgi:UDP-glucose 4-epimerase
MNQPMKISEADRIPPRRYVVVGGAGFIGGHFVDALLSDEATEAVTIYDNFSSGREWHYERWVNDPRFRVVRGDVKDVELLTATFAGHHAAIHLASNPDIARAATDPAIDFVEGTLLTHNVVEAARRSGCSRVLYASGSGVYGDLGEVEAREDHGPLRPISTYGASKLAGEAMLSAYCHMFDLTACIFRFGNVVGPRQTHGVGFDFARRLLEDPKRLRILGDGSQSKSYIHVEDVVRGVLHAERECRERCATFNLATGDYITVRDIADLAVEAVGLPPGSVAFEFTGGDRGWKGDVPVVRLNTDRIRSLGWTCAHSSRAALLRSLSALLVDARAGKL